MPPSAKETEMRRSLNDNFKLPINNIIGFICNSSFKACTVCRNTYPTSTTPSLPNLQNTNHSTGITIIANLSFPEPSHSFQETEQVHEYEPYR